jgi:hypothetical protein
MRTSAKDLMNNDGRTNDVFMTMLIRECTYSETALPLPPQASIYKTHVQDSKSRAMISLWSSKCPMWPVLVSRRSDCHTCTHLSRSAR